MWSGRSKDNGHERTLAPGKGEFVIYGTPSHIAEASAEDEHFGRWIGLKSYELKNHLGNVLTVISDRKTPKDDNLDEEIDRYVADILSSTDYYPFGMGMPGRSYTSADGYRWGFNGQEKDDEIAGPGNIYTAEYWEYDSRLGRRWNLDPVPRPYESHYATFSDNPMRNIDPNGDSYTDFINKKTGEAIRVEDGSDKVVTVDDPDFQTVKGLGADTKKTWSEEESNNYMNIAENATEITAESDLGKIARVVYAEMSGINNTSNTDRAIVAESIVNRKASGLYGKTYSDILISKEYNAITEDRYQDPIKYMADLKKDYKYFYAKNEKKIIGNYLDAYSAAYKAYNNIGDRVGNGVVSYVSPPLKSTAFDKDPYLTNITSTISGLKGISGVWKRK